MEKWDLTMHKQNKLGKQVGLETAKGSAGWLLGPSLYWLQVMYVGVSG